MVLLLLSQRWTPPLRHQVSHRNTFLMTCDTPTMADFCRESIESCPGNIWAYRTMVEWCRQRKNPNSSTRALWHSTTRVIW
jgi:hypothetical protein